MSMKQQRLEQLKCYRGIPNIEYGMYVEVYDLIFSKKIYYGFFVDTTGDYICLVDNKGKKLSFHPTWQTVYYDNPVDKNVIYDFREEI